LTDNWVELTVRFVSDLYTVRALKDRMSRDILDALRAAKIPIASSTYDIIGMPRLQVDVRTQTTPESAPAA